MLDKSIILPVTFEFAVLSEYVSDGRKISVVVLTWFIPY